MDSTSVAIALFSTSTLSLFLGLWAFLDAPGKRLNVLFLLLCVSVAGWTAIVGSSELLFAKGLTRGSFSIGLGYLFGSLIPFFFLLVCRDIDYGSSRSNLLPAITLAACVLCIYLGFNGHIVKRLSISSSTLYYDFTTGWGFPVFATYVVSLAALSAREIAKRYSQSQNSFLRLQLMYFSLGAAASFLVALLCNLVLPAFHVSYFSPIGAISPIAALSTIFIAITRHRLLNLRISFRRGAMIAAWIILFLVPLCLSMVFGRPLTFMPLASRMLFSIVIALWAYVLYSIAQSGERSFVALGGDKAYVYKNTLDDLARSLVGVISTEKVIKLYSEYLRNNHGIDEAVLWYRSPKGQYTIVSPSDSKYSINRCAHIFEAVCVDSPRGDIIVFAPAPAAGPPLAAESIQIYGLIVLPPIKPGILFISLMGDLHPDQLDKSDLDLIVSFSNYVAAALRSSIQMEQIETLNATLTQTQEILSSYSRKLESSVDERTATLQSLLDEQVVFFEIFVHDVCNQLSSTIVELAGSRTMCATDLRAQLLSIQELVRESAKYLSSSETYGDVSPSSLRNVINGILDEHRAIIDRKNIVIECSHIDDDVGNVFAVKEILVNVILNAIKYVGDKTSSCIKIGCVKGPSSIVIHVTDNGIGIPPKETPRVFVPLFRGSNQTVRNGHVPGFGMGLSIAARLAGRIGASIAISSKVSSGTEVVISLPIHTSNRIDQIL